MARNDAPLLTPDGRYIVVRGRLWRTVNPALPDDVVQAQTGILMDARRRLRRGASSAEERANARAAVHTSKVALGERGPVWWTDGAPDFNRHLVKNSPYREWFAGLLR